jgi:hypothetical protein
VADHVLAGIMRIGVSPLSRMRKPLTLGTLARASAEWRRSWSATTEVEP